MPGIIALRLIGEAAEDNILRSVAMHSIDVAQRERLRNPSLKDVDYVSVVPFIRDEDGNEEVCNSDDEGITGWWVQLVPSVENIPKIEVVGEYPTKQEAVKIGYEWGAKLNRKVYVE